MFRIVLALSTVALASLASLTGNPGAAPGDGDEIPLKYARIYWEYNASANDLGVHVTLDGEDWKKLRIINPRGNVLFNVTGKGPYNNLGMTELFFEGAEPSLDDFPLEDLLALFPEGEYEFEGITVDGEETDGEWQFSHAIPDGPDVFATVAGSDYLRIDWTAVTDTPPGFPDLPLDIVSYQVIVESFLVTVPASVLSLTVSPEFVATLAPGEHQFEVLAIDANANQTLTEGYFIK
jgi:hypothetical protein